jgi:hypothetical protein
MTGDLFVIFLFSFVERGHLFRYEVMERRLHTPFHIMS